MAIKSLEDLRKIKAEAKKQTETRKLNEKQVIIGMGTCGIAAGARAVMTAVLEELAKRNIHDVAVLQTGCIGMCQYEPIVEVLEPGNEKDTYVKVTPEMVARIVSDHLVNGNPVGEFTVGAIAK